MVTMASPNKLVIVNSDKLEATGKCLDNLVSCLCLKDQNIPNVVVDVDAAIRGLKEAFDDLAKSAIVRRPKTATTNPEAQHDGGMPATEHPAQPAVPAPIYDPLRLATIGIVKAAVSINEVVQSNNFLPQVDIGAMVNPDPQGTDLPSAAPLNTTDALAVGYAVPGTSFGNPARNVVAGIADGEVEVNVARARQRSKVRAVPAGMTTPPLSSSNTDDEWQTVGRRSTAAPTGLATATSSMHLTVPIATTFSSASGGEDVKGALFSRTREPLPPGGDAKLHALLDSRVLDDASCIKRTCVRQRDYPLWHAVLAAAAWTGQHVVRQNNSYQPNYLTKEMTRAHKLARDVRKVLQRAGGDERAIADMSPLFYADLVDLGHSSRSNTALEAVLSELQQPGSMHAREVAAAARATAPQMAAKMRAILEEAMHGR